MGVAFELNPRKRELGCLEKGLLGRRNNLSKYGKLKVM